MRPPPVADYNSNHHDFTQRIPVAFAFGEPKQLTFGVSISISISDAVNISIAQPERVAVTVAELQLCVRPGTGMQLS
ncbi:MAG: hypothetical protein H0U53_08465 [Actinobacteria bacterium]|nr:hypothetical protein [Actinomycetota bacterium]